MGAGAFFFPNFVAGSVTPEFVGSRDSGENFPKFQFAVPLGVRFPPSLMRRDWFSPIGPFP